MHRLQERGALAPLRRGRTTFHPRRLVLPGAVAAAVIASDQLTKALAVSRLSHGPIHLVGPFDLDLEYNRGVAFSLGSSIGAPLVAIAIAVVILVISLGRRAPGRVGQVAVGLIAGGAIGNLADRLFRSQGVVDFLRSGFWPTFNLADSAIVIGCILLAITLIRERAPEAMGEEE